MPGWPKKITNSWKLLASYWWKTYSVWRSKEWK